MGTAESNSKRSDRRMYIVMGVFSLISLLLLITFLSLQTIQISQNAEQINQTQVQQHEDQARLNQTLVQFQHEDEIFRKQQAFENEQRDIQRYKIVKDTNKSMNKSLNKLMDNFTQFQKESENRSAISFRDRDRILDTVNNATGLLVNITEKHDRDSKYYRNNALEIHKKILDLLNNKSFTTR